MTDILTDTKPKPPAMTATKAHAAGLASAIGTVILAVLMQALTSAGVPTGAMEAPAPAETQSALMVIIQAVAVGAAAWAVTWLSPANRPKPPSP